jgi:hypothetical protein
MTNDNIIPEVTYQSIDIDELKSEIQSAVVSNNNNSVQETPNESVNVSKFNINKILEENNVTKTQVNSPQQVEVNREQVNINEQPITIRPEEFETKVYEAAFNFIKEQELLYFPENVELSEEGLQEAISNTRQILYEKALDDIRASAGDEHVAYLLDLALNGGTIEDVQLAKQAIDDEISFENINLEDPDQRTYLLRMFLAEGLDPDNPAHKVRLDKIDEEIQQLVDKMEDLELASKAKEFYIEKAREFKRQQAAYIKQKQEEAKRLELEQLRQQHEWNQEFKEILYTRNISEEKRKKIIRQFDIVKLDDNTEIELWKYKWQKIWESPRHTQELMDFLSDFDEYTLEFVKRSETPSKIATQKIMQIAASKGASRGNSTYTSFKPKQNNPSIDLNKW